MYLCKEDKHKVSYIFSYSKAKVKHGLVLTRAHTPIVSQGQDELRSFGNRFVHEFRIICSFVDSAM